MPTGVYPRTKAHREATGKSSIGRIPWNKGLTKETDSRVATNGKAIGIANTGGKHPWAVGRKAWNKGLTRETAPTLAVPWNKGLTKETSLKVAAYGKAGGKARLGCMNGCKNILAYSKGPRTAIHRRHIRLAILRRIQEQLSEGGQLVPSYNSQACRYFETINKWAVERGYPPGQHATNGGEFYVKELGYFLDYFNPGLKLIMEWDEPSHYDKSGNLRVKDIQRQREIQGLYLDFRFVRIKQIKEDKLNENNIEN